jgi:hypothetical protein
MAKSSKPKVPVEHWKDTPDDHDFPAATDYLTLTNSLATSEAIVADLKSALIEHRKAKDLLRASCLELLGPDNFHVAVDLEKVRKGRQLSPVLLVRGDATRGVPLIVADGYHRICASYHIDENADVPCKIVDPHAPGPVKRNSVPKGPTAKPAP